LHVGLFLCLGCAKKDRLSVETFNLPKGRYDQNDAVRIAKHKATLYFVDYQRKGKAFWRAGHALPETEDPKAFLRRMSDFENRLVNAGFLRLRFPESNRFAGDTYYARQIGSYLFEVNPRPRTIVITHYRTPRNTRVLAQRELVLSWNWERVKTVYVRSWPDVFYWLEKYGALK
jgi:hypothetical protein